MWQGLAITRDFKVDVDFVVIILHSCVPISSVNLASTQQAVHSNDYNTAHIHPNKITSWGVQFAS